MHTPASLQRPSSGWSRVWTDFCVSDGSAVGSWVHDRHALRPGISCWRPGAPRCTMHAFSPVAPESSLGAPDSSPRAPEPSPGAPDSPRERQNRPRERQNRPRERHGSALGALDRDTWSGVRLDSDSDGSEMAPMAKIICFPLVFPSFRWLCKPEVPAGLRSPRISFLSLFSSY